MDQMEREISRLCEEKLNVGRKASVYQRPTAWEGGFPIFKEEPLRTKPPRVPTVAPQVLSLSLPPAPWC